MNTILKTKIPKNIRGILYLCKFDREKLTIKVEREILCSNAFDALNLYAEIPNPESQLVTSPTYEGLCESLEILHKNMKDKTWLKELSECL